MGLLQDAGLADFYQQDVFGLNDLLVACSQRGMPVDPVKRLEAAQALEQQRQAVLAELQALVPDAIKPRKVYKRLPKAIPIEQLCCDDVLVAQKVCAYCFKRRPNKKHPCFKAKCTICWQGEAQHCDLDEPGLDHPWDCAKVHHEFKVGASDPKYAEQQNLEPRWSLLLPFVISPQGIIKYLKHKGYAVPTYRDRETGQTKQTTDENALRRLALKYEQDRFFPTVLKHRELQKTLGTYVGYPE